MTTDPLLLPLSDAVVETLARAIFAKPGAIVTAAGDAIDAEPQVLADAAAACANARHGRDKPGAYAQWTVYYPDMGGAMVVRRKDVRSTEDRRAGVRYEVEGWGLLNVVLHLAGRSPAGSWVSANSEKRALAWYPTIPDLGPVDAWHWPAVAAHERRLRRVLRLAAAQAAS